MNKKQFLYELWGELERIPPQEREEAMRYYEEYLEDAGPEREQEALEELGTPKEVAAQILADAVVKDLEQPVKSAKQGFSRVWMVLLAVFASPIALPVAAVIAALALVLVTVAVALVLAVICAGIGLVLGGALTAAGGLMVLAQSPATTLCFAGAGLAGIGAGIFICLGGFWLGRKSLAGLARLFGRWLKREKKQKQEEESSHA